MSNTPGVYEILEKVSKIARNQDKINALRENDCFALRVVLQGAFDPAVQWLLPPGKPPYKVSELVDQQNVLYREARKITYFVKGFADDLPQVRRESMFIEFLESLDPKDADLICSIKEKKLPFKNITQAIVKEAFPDLIPEPVAV